MQDDQINTYTQASSSDMINYERYNGSSEYLQYSTDIISDMPSCIEDEERVSFVYFQVWILISLYLSI